MHFYHSDTIRVVQSQVSSSRDGIVVKVLASHQCGSGVIPALGHIWVECGAGSRLAQSVFHWFPKFSFHPSFLSKYCNLHVS